MADKEETKVSQRSRHMKRTLMWLRRRLAGDAEALGWIDNALAGRGHPKNWRGGAADGRP